MSTDTASATKVITGIVRFSYLHVWEPASIDDNTEKKYSASLIIPKSDTDTVNRVKAAIKEAAELGKAKLGGKIPANLKTPLRDGDVDRPEDAAYANSWFINATSKTKPGIVGKNPKESIIDTEEFYSGCYGRASINFYAFNTSGNKGIAAGLNNLQKTKDGDPLSGRSRAEDDFEEVAEEDEDMFK